MQQQDSQLPIEQVPVRGFAREPQLTSELDADSTRAAISIEDAMALETTVARGELAADSPAGTILYRTAVAPAFLSSTVTSRIQYLSKMFSQWHGDLEFGLYVTKAIFQQTKLMMVFVPGQAPAEVAKMTVESLLGYQIRSILNPDNFTSARLRIPFIHTANWQYTTGSIGTVVVLQLERIVVTQQTNSTIPWILTVCSPKGPNQIKFRYAIMPPDEGGVRPDIPDNDSGISVNSTIGHMYAASSSRRPRTKLVDGKAIQADELYINSPVYGAPTPLETGVAIAWSDQTDDVLLAERLSHLPLAPPFSFTFDAPTSMKSLVPYLPTITNLRNVLPNGTGGYPDGYDWYLTSSDSSVVDQSIKFGKNGAAFFITFGCPPQVVKDFNGWRVDMICLRPDHSTRFTILKAIQTDSPEQLKLVIDMNNSPDTEVMEIVVTSPIFFFDDPINYYSKHREIEYFLRSQLQKARAAAVSTHWMLYVAAPLPTAAKIREYLVNPDSSARAPPMAQGAKVSFSMSQAGGLYSMLSSQATSRGIFTWLFNLFSGDSSSPWYKVARIADAIFDFVVPLIVAYDGSVEPFELSTTRLTYVEAVEGVARLATEQSVLPMLTTASLGPRALSSTSPEDVQTKRTKGARKRYRRHLLRLFRRQAASGDDAALSSISKTPAESASSDAGGEW